MTKTAIAFTAFASLTGTAVAHHGWGSYDAAKPITVTGAILTSKFENPHATITVQQSDKTPSDKTQSEKTQSEKTWTIILAPTSRMTTRGALANVVAVGNNVSAYGYPSTVVKDEMRAERITVDKKTYEMR